VNQNKGKVEN